MSGRAGDLSVHPGVRVPVLMAADEGARAA